MISRTTLGAALTLLLAVGCSSDPVAPPATIDVPKKGSTFTYAHYELDDDGVKIPGSDTTYLFTITSDDTTVSGKSGVVMLSRNPAQKPIPYKYESNGDISILSRFHNGSYDAGGVVVYEFDAPETWVALPFGSKRKEETTVLSYDTTATVRGEPAGYTVRQTVIYHGDEELTVGTEKVTASKITLKTHWEVHHGTRGETVDYSESMWYSPKVGFMVRMEGTRTSNFLPRFLEWRYDLTAYSRK